MSISKFIPPKFILLNLCAGIVILIMIGYLAISNIGTYTKHGQYITVPPFYSLSQQEALELAKGHKLRMLITDSIYNADLLPGTVLEQYPTAGTQVKENRMVHLIINSSSPEKVIFPNLQNTAFRQTLQTLEGCGFQIGRIEYTPSDFKNLVVGFKQQGMDIQPGTEMEKGTIVDIVLGNGNNDYNAVFVPQLTGKMLQEAIQMAKHSYLNIGRIIPDATVKDKTDLLRAIVYQQEPAYYEQETANAGSEINLYVSLNKNKRAAIDSLMVTE